MKKILLIKTSSLGDVIHALPAVTDLKAAGALARIDWVVEESLVSIVKLHPGVDGVIPVVVTFHDINRYTARHMQEYLQTKAVMIKLD